MAIVIGVGIKLIFFKSPFYYAGIIELLKVDISARVTSVISNFSVKEGDRIQKGQKLMTLSCEDYRLTQNIARLDFEITERLFRAGSQTMVSWCEITAPLNGIVLNKYHELGEMVTPGTRLFTLANLKEDIYAYIYVPQTPVSQLKVSQTLTGSLPELNMRAFSGKSVVTSEASEFTPKNVQTREERTRLVYGIKLAFENEDETLKPGMTIEVLIPVAPNLFVLT